MAAGGEYDCARHHRKATTLKAATQQCLADENCRGFSGDVLDEALLGVVVPPHSLLLRLASETNGGCADLVACADVRSRAHSWAQRARMLLVWWGPQCLPVGANGTFRV